MIDHQQVAYYQSQRDRVFSVRCLWGVFAHFGIPMSMVDVGCGAGDVVAAARHAGCHARGYDLHAGIGSGVEWLITVDLRQPLNSDDPVDMVLCWETAEHLPPEAADTLCNSICGLMQPGAILIFTAATPGQGGSGHLNEQPHEYWREKFASRGLSKQTNQTELLRATWRVAAGPCHWYPDNVQVFR